MKTNAFSDALTYLDDELISEVRTKRNAVRQPWMGWAAAAACAALVIFAGTQLRPAAPTPVAPAGPEVAEPVAPAQPERNERALIYSSDVPDGSEANCYATPRPGTCNYTLGVRAALEEHKGYGVAYLVAFDLFTKDGIAADGEKAAEYRRLAEAGIQLFETSVWEYEGPEGARRDYTVVTAMVTAEELASFPVNPSYGYGFYFPSNGDSSRPEVVPGNALVLPDW